MPGLIASRPTHRSLAPAQTELDSIRALPKVLLCDLDGTLIDTMPVLADLATEVMIGIYGIARRLARELYLATCGLPFIQQLARIFPDDPRNASASELFESGKPSRCGLARMPADTRAALVALKHQGMRIAVSSNNGAQNVAAFSKSAGFPFDLVMGYGGGLAKGRPHVQMVERAIGVGRGEMLFVGDSLHDGEIALALGVPFVGMAGTFAKESFLLRFPGRPVIHRFAELLDLFEVKPAAAVVDI